MFRAREVLELGSFWQVGNGSSLNVWSDKWIPRLLSFKVVGNFQGVDVDLWVSNFIDWDRCC